MIKHEFAVIEGLMFEIDILGKFGANVDWQQGIVTAASVLLRLQLEFAAEQSRAQPEGVEINTDFGEKQGYVSQVRDDTISTSHSCPKNKDTLIVLQGDVLQCPRTQNLVNCVSGDLKMSKDVLRK